MTAGTRAAADPRAWIVVLAAALAWGCGGGDDDMNDAAGDDAGDDIAGDDDDGGSSGEPVDDSMGTFELSFSVGGTVAESMNLVDPLSGTVYGGVFRTADVGATGPREGAEQIAFVEATGVDLTSGTASAVLWTSEPVPPDTYTFLGFFDVDGSSAETEEKDPEEGDPVTLPTVNQVMVVAGEAAPLEVRFDLVL